jgi:MFS-type transporter involved in bile tolerance (Atg22 family)
LLNAVSVQKDSHQISSRSFITGYVGMVAFGITVLLVLAVIHFVAGVDASFVLYGITPNVSVGLWYLFFGVIVQRNFPIDCGIGPPFPIDGLISDTATSNKQEEASANAQRNMITPLSTPMTSPRASLTSAALLTKSGTASSQGDESVPTRDVNAETRKERASIERHMHSGRVSESVLSMNSDFDNQSIPMPKTSVDSTASSQQTQTTNTTVTFNTSSLNPRESYTLWGSIYWFFVYGLEHGTRTQLNNLREFHKFPDLFLFIVAFVFIEGAQNTGVSLAAIIVADIFSVSDSVIVICGGCGLVASILGLYMYKFLNYKGWLSPKQILMINIVVFIILILGFLFITNSNANVSFIIFAIVGGSQIGSVGAFARSIVANLCPTHRQSRVFSLYQFCQVATAWIGPLIIASVNSATDGNCVEFIYLTVFVVVGQLLIGLPLLWKVDIERGLQLRNLREQEDGYLC